MVGVASHLSLDGEPDARLVQLARGKNEGAVRVLVRRYNQRLFRVARSVLRNDGEAEDVVQASYVRAFTHLDTFRGEAQFSTWLTRIALNEAIGRLRRKRPTAGVEALDEYMSHPSAEIIQFPSLSPTMDPEIEMSRSEVRELIERAVDELPASFRTVFVFRDIEGLTVEETAEQLGIKPETVKTRLHRARKSLRLAIEARMGSALSSIFPFDGARCVHMADRVVAQLRDHW